MAYFINDKGEKQRLQPDHNGKISLIEVNGEIVVNSTKEEDATDKPMHDFFKNVINPTK